MPEGRMIRRKIADSERLNRLPVEARLLYDRLILFVDKEARHHANPRLLLRRFFPLDNYDDKDMEEWLQGLYAAKKNGKGLIELYEIDGLRFLWLPGFEGEQSKSWVKFTKEKEAESSIPEPPPLGKGKKKPDIKTDTKLKDMVDLFENKVGRPATPKELEQLKDMSSTYELDSFKEAVEEAGDKRNLTYIERILESKREPEPEEPTTDDESEGSGEVELE
ncbi:hypothetical protein LCGC14_2715760 [marine sediment metagenome]|uniref:DnaB/C C-terminal domain-containing protein n=1 Tax=marine sediment metagenome TaxID=412755 RepID=A0A0F9C3A7_9ZZZZ